MLAHINAFIQWILLQVSFPQHYFNRFVSPVCLCAAQTESQNNMQTLMLNAQKRLTKLRNDVIKLRGRFYLYSPS